MPSLRRIPVLLVALLLNGLIAPAAGWGQEVLVELASGRRFLGTVDARTSDRELWLRFGDSTAHVLRPIDWASIRRAMLDGAEVPLGRLRAQAAALPKPALPSLGEQLAAVRRIAPPAPGQTSPQPPRAETRVPVRALHLEAVAANWDGDAEVDGLIVAAYPLGEAGQIVPVAGSLELELYGARRLTATRGEPVPLVSRWTASFAAAEVGERGARLRLPFQSFHPDYDASLASFAELHGRLVVPGEGVFEASAGVVRIRPFSPLRDRLEQLRGTRQFPSQTPSGAGSLNRSRP